MPSIQGHRGCRGLLPENTIEGFKHALDMGCEFIELDITITKDREVLVSHDAFPSAEYCTHPSIALASSNEKNYNFFAMKYSEIREFDCGMKPHSRFPQQVNTSAYKPLLREMVKELEIYYSNFIYNIEIKSEEATDSVYHPKPEEYVQILLKELDELDITTRCFIQSFDVRPLSIIHQIRPEIKLGYIVGYNEFDDNMEKIDFIPNAYVAHYSLVDAELVSKVHQIGMKLFVWTVNRPEEMNRILSLNIDSIITDYPDLLLQKINHPT
ncbi:glycerophosphodiester phosphodiesterase family protein [Flavobacteriales bacterium]|nr:glycerophosphodiester phosphodiesterase family protein [Flavobacteriales bacterium]